MCSNETEKQSTTTTRRHRRNMRFDLICCQNHSLGSKKLRSCFSTSIPDSMTKIRKFMRGPSFKPYCATAIPKAERLFRFTSSTPRLRVLGGSGGGGNFAGFCRSSSQRCLRAHYSASNISHTTQFVSVMQAFSCRLRNMDLVSSDPRLHEGASS